MQDGMVRSSRTHPARAGTCIWYLQAHVPTAALSHEGCRADIDAAFASQSSVEEVHEALKRQTNKAWASEVLSLINKCVHGGHTSKRLFPARCFPCLLVKGPLTTRLLHHHLPAMFALSRGSPTSQKLTFEQLQRGALLPDLAACLTMENRMVLNMLERPKSDFVEGVRAMLIDRDNKPVWKPATLAEVRLPP